MYLNAGENYFCESFPGSVFLFPLISYGAVRWGGGESEPRLYLKPAAGKRGRSEGLPLEPLEINVNTPVLFFIG